jgi:hypothetical protein
MLPPTENSATFRKFACLASIATLGKFAGGQTHENVLRLLDFDRLKPIPIHF